MNRKHHLDSLAVAALIILCASWGGQQVAIKLILADVSPVMQAAIRSIGATMLVAAGIYLVNRQGAYTNR